MNKPVAERRTVPGAYVGLLVDVVARWNVTVEQLLDDSDLAAGQLLDPSWQIDFDVYTHLLRRALALTGEPGLGFHLGLQMKVTCHGLIGFAAMIASDVRGALEVAQEFLPLQSSAVGLRLVVEGDMASLYVDQKWPDRALCEAGALFVLLGFAQMGEAVTGRKLHGIGDFTFPRPDYFDRFEHLLPGTVRFSQPETRAVFPAGYLDLPLIMADPLTARLAREQCKRELNALAGRAGVAGLVRELIYDEALGFGTMDDVAVRLHVSVRTLQRQLAQEGSSFSAILDEQRRHHAIRLVRQHQASLESVAEKLGYSDVTNFSRAFRRWTGKTPARFRG